MSGGGDGLYFRTGAKTHGPFTRLEFERLSATGEVAKGSRAWRQASGNYYKINVESRLKWSGIFSCAACGHATEIASIMLMLGVVVFSLSLKQVREELKAEHGALAFIVFMTLVVFVMIVANLRRTAGKMARVTTEMTSTEEV